METKMEQKMYILKKKILMVLLFKKLTFFSNSQIPKNLLLSNMMSMSCITMCIHTMNSCFVA